MLKEGRETKSGVCDLISLFFSCLLLEDAFYFLVNTQAVPQGCAQEAACVRLPPVVCQRGSVRKGRKRGKEERENLYV